MATPANRPVTVDHPVIRALGTPGDEPREFDYGGLSIVEVDRGPEDPEDVTKALFDDGVEPVLGAFVLGSSAVVIVGYSQAGRWGTWLDFEAIASNSFPPPPMDWPGDRPDDPAQQPTIHWDDPEYAQRCAEIEAGLRETVPTLEEAAPLAARWAREAGCDGVDEAVVLDTMRRTRTFAEDQLFALYRALGFVPEDYQPDEDD